MSEHAPPTSQKGTHTDRTCDLCGLPLRGGTVESVISGRTWYFCCNGCRHVFQMISQSEDLSPDAFTSSEIFKRCREMGIIPAPETGPDKAEPTSATDTASDGETLRLHLSVGGMWCPSCAWVINASLAGMPGVFQPECRFATDTFQCDYDPVVTSPEKIVHTIKGLGYSTHGTDADAEKQGDRREFIRLVVSAFLTMNVMMLSWALYSGFFSDLGQAGIRFLSIPIFAMAAVVFFYGGARIHARGWRQLALGSYGMETLISLGAAIVFTYSIWSLFERSLHLYFDTASMLITLVLLGKTLESRAKASAGKDLAHFFSMSPRKVRICTEENEEGRYVAIDHLGAGDLFRLTEGEVAPADGVVVSGRGAGDESALTGESKPKQKSPGDTLVSGTRLVSGDLTVKALQVGDDATLGQMMHLMKNALGGKTVMDSQMDRLLRWFVPGVVLLALATAAVLLLSGAAIDTALLRMITVLVVSCPCALGVAIPLTRSVGIAAAGRKGLLVRDAAAFDRARSIRSLIFDKTGTVTTGQWRLLEVKTQTPHTETEVLELAAGLEQGSDNAAALSLVRHAREKKILPQKVTGIKDFENGRTGTHGGRALRIGSEQFLEDEIKQSSLFRTLAPAPASASRVYLSLAGDIIAVFIFGDDIRPDAATVINTLKRWRLRVGMVSGDGEAATRQVADTLGVSEWRGAMLPEAKMRFVEKWQGSSEEKSQDAAGVAVVGDGVNDAPALARSDLGIAVKAGAPLGKETAHVTLMRGELSQVVDFFQLARTVQKKIRQNLTLTILYNAVCIPIAMAGLLSPLVAVCAMLLSSISVIGNTIHLNRKLMVDR